MMELSKQNPVTGYYKPETVEAMIAVADEMESITDIVVGEYREWTGSYYVEIYHTSNGLDEFWRRVNKVKNG